MYESFFGFHERPFDLSPNPKFLVLTESHREVLSNLEYAIASRKGVTLVIGEPGSGKTTLIRAVLKRQPEYVHSVHLSNPTLSRQEFVETLAVKFGLSPAATKSKATMLVELEALLMLRRDAGEPTVLIVDEAQSAPDHILEEIRLLANIETDDQKLLSVILAGQPELATRLEDTSLRQLKQRVALRCELGRLSLRETAGYIAGRIAAAGGVGAQVFTREAVARIHEAAGGLPRTISVLADNALIGGFAAGQKPVNGKTVQDVCRDFRLETEARPAAATNGLFDRVPPDPPASPPEVADRVATRLVERNVEASTGGSTAEAPAAAGVAAGAAPDKPTGWLSVFHRRHIKLFESDGSR